MGDETRVGDGEVDERTGPLAAAGREFLVRRDIAFLNHGSFGARPRSVQETYRRWQQEVEQQPVEFLGRRLTGLLAEARGRVAAYVGTEADQLVFVPNTTHGINIIARSLDLRPGDEVLGTDHEYGAVERTWRFVCGQRGATYRTQPLTLPVTDADTLVDTLWQGVTSRTRVLVVSHITSPTALILPVAAICQRAAREGILTVVDGAHAPGQIPVDVKAIGADFYVGNCHKWLCAPLGAGFLYARPERQSLLQPLVVSWGWQPRQPGPSPFQDLFEWVGTDDPSAYLSVPAAIDFQAQHDWPAVRATCHAAAADARARIAALTGLPQISPESADWWGQMCAVPLPLRQDVTAAELQRRLWQEFQVEVPVLDWNEWRFVRISVQAYNTLGHLARLVEGLARLL
jgi:isopenicillin-N epimerase